MQEWQRTRGSHLDRLNEGFAGLVESAGFRVLDSGSEKHGTWIWLAASTQGDITTFVAMGITDSPSNWQRAGRPRFRATTPCRLELWVGADDGTSFSRALRVRRPASWETIDAVLEVTWPQLIADAKEAAIRGLDQRYHIGDAALRPEHQ